MKKACNENKERAISNTKATYKGNGDSVLFADGASIEFNQTNDIEPKLIEYNNAINMNGLNINCGNVNILTRKSNNDIKNITKNPLNP